MVVEMIKTTVCIPTLCKCGNGMYQDRHINADTLGCPACDPELGESVEQRKENYKSLISTPSIGINEHLMRKRSDDN